MKELFACTVTHVGNIKQHLSHNTNTAALNQRNCNGIYNKDIHKRCSQTELIVVNNSVVKPTNNIHCIFVVKKFQFKMHKLEAEK